MLQRHDPLVALFQHGIHKVKVHERAYPPLRPAAGDPPTYFCPLPTVHDDAICIRVWDWSETSQTVSLFCRELGVVRGLAKGSKRDDARFSGGFELLTRGQAGVILKSSDAMATLTSWDLAEVFPGARSDLATFYCAMAMLDIVHHLVKDHDPHPALFDMLVEDARRLGDTTQSAHVLVSFLWSALSEAGYRPELERDVRTSLPLDRPESLVFDPRLGGFSAVPSENGTDENWRTRRQTLQVLHDLASTKSPGHSLESTVRAGKLLAAYVRELTASPLHSLQSALDALLR